VYRYSIALLTAAAAMLPAGAAAQGFKPTRPVEIVVHSGVGAGNDVVARVVSGILEKERLLPVRSNVVNKPGGNGVLAMAYLAERKGEPHVIAMYTAQWLTQPLMSREVRVQFHDLTPIANLVQDPAVIVVKADSPYRTLADFIEAAKKTPGQLRQPGSSIESRANLIRLILQRRSGASWTHIPYPSGADRITALLGGHAHIYIGDPPEINEHVASGSLRAIVQIAEKRLPTFPNVPTMQEAGFENPNIRSVRGIIAPPGLPKEVVDYWESVFARMVKTDSWRKYVVDSQVEEWYLRSSELGKLAEEIVAQRRQMFAEFGIKMAR
jgi:putative tricarboxylic transport membrane protein